MRHKKKKVSLGRKTGPRKALLKTLCRSLIDEGAIKTTKAKASAVQDMIEPLITRGKEATIHDLRNIESTLGSKRTAQKLVKEISPRFAKRNGGYTSIVKLGARKGDRAEIVSLRFVE